MTSDPWLPSGFDLESSFKLRGLLYAGEGWQIYRTAGGGALLIVVPELVNWWEELGLIERELFTPITIKEQPHFYLSSGVNGLLEPVSEGGPPQTNADALSFVHSLNATRKIFPKGSLESSLFVERYSRLLPTLDEDEGWADDEVLGTWLTGGVHTSVLSFRRLHALCGWMAVKDLIELVRAAGFEVPPGSDLLERPRPPSSYIARSQGGGQADEAARVLQDGQDSQDRSSTDRKQSFCLPGRKSLEEFFIEHVIDIIFNAERYRAMGIEFPSAIILHGPPGCGKTFAVERLIEFIGWPSYSVNSNSVGSPYIHETSKKISEVFDKALDNAPSVVVIDEMEAFLSDRRSGSSTGLHHIEEVAEFLRRIPEAINNRVLIIGMTNMIESIDPAILRRGRFDHIIEVGMPSTEEVRSLLHSLLEGIPQSADLNLDRFVEELSGKPLSDSAFFVREAARLAAKAGKPEVDEHCLDEALSSLPRERAERRNRIGFVWGEDKDKD
ncbi:AAA family ATPase [Marinobacter segnicrescens]|uniref:AAA family ATPase n=1 Tax=Marinobacter segnicrescens TaxID=430453 RepID=UPI003A8FA015